MPSNQFHTAIESLPQWQQNYIAELKRTAGKDAGFSDNGSGWYSLQIQDEQMGSITTESIRKGRIEQMTLNLRSRPDFQPDKDISYTKGQFDRAVELLMGASDYESFCCTDSWDRANLVTEIAKRDFLGELPSGSVYDSALTVVRFAAKNLWRKDGSLGLL